MRSVIELRKESRGIVFRTNPGWRLVWTFVFLALAGSCALSAVAGLSRLAGVETWDAFAATHMEMLTQGVNLVPPSSSAAWRMTAGSAFVAFLQFVIQGILALGMASATLAVMRGLRDFGTWSGMRRPLSAAWLLFRISLQIALWTVLLFVPGLVAFYRYRFAWFLAADHPDWSAGRCLAESGRLLRGRKLGLFALDCSFWLPFTVLMVAAVGFVFLPTLFAALAQIFVLAGFFALMAWMKTATALFYSDLLSAQSAGMK